MIVERTVDYAAAEAEIFSPTQHLMLALIKSTTLLSINTNLRMLYLLSCVGLNRLRTKLPGIQKNIDEAKSQLTELRDNNARTLQASLEVEPDLDCPLVQRAGAVFAARIHQEYAKNKLTTDFSPNLKDQIDRLEIALSAKLSHQQRLTCLVDALSDIKNFCDEHLSHITSASNGTGIIAAPEKTIAGAMRILPLQDSLATMLTKIGTLDVNYEWYRGLLDTLKTLSTAFDTLGEDLHKKALPVTGAWMKMLGLVFMNPPVPTASKFPDTPVRILSTPTNGSGAVTADL